VIATLQWFLFIAAVLSFLGFIGDTSNDSKPNPESDNKPTPLKAFVWR